MEVAGKVQAGDGSTSTPGLAFRLDKDTGLYRPGTDRLQIVTGGSARWEVDASGNLFPVDTNTVDLGDATHAIRDLYMNGSLKGTQVDALGWNPALTAVTTNPTLGTGSSVSGHVVQYGKTVVGWGKILFGTAGTNAGSGQYRVSSPLTIDSASHTTRDTLGVVGGLNAGGAWSGVLRYNGTATFSMVDSKSGSAVTQAIPGAWTANDEISYSFMYLGT